MAKLNRLIKKLDNKTRFQEIIGDIKDFICSYTIDPFRKYYQMFKRMIFWGWNMRRSYDWDVYGVYRMVNLKLDRCYKEFRDNGYCVWNSSESSNRMRKLRTAIELSKRLDEDKYLDKGFIEHDKKWGEVKVSYKPLDNGLSNVIFKRPGIKTEEDEIKAKKEIKALMKKANKQKESDKKQFFDLLYKNIEIWWD